MKQNKRGVIRIIEAIIAILILLGVVLTLLTRQPLKVDFASSVYNIEKQILSEIEGRNDLRSAVLSSDKTAIDCFIQSRIEKYGLEYNTTICPNPLEFCPCLGAPRDKEVYSAEVIISTNITQQELGFKKLLICAWIGKMSQHCVAPVCGDGSCNGAETCSTCPADCGACPPTCTAQYICINSKGRHYQNANCTFGTTENAPTCNPTKQKGVCLGATQNCVSGNWVDCTDADYTTWASSKGWTYASIESGGLCQSGEGQDNDCDGCIDMKDKTSCRPTCTLGADGCCQ